MTTRRASLISSIGFESLVIATLVMGCGSSTSNTNPPNNGGSTSTTSGGATSNGRNRRYRRWHPSFDRRNEGFGGVEQIQRVERQPLLPVAPLAPRPEALQLARYRSAATTGTGGSTAVDCNPPVHCSMHRHNATAALISDFTIASGSTTPPVFGTYGKSIYGGEYIYPTSTPACGTQRWTPIRSRRMCLEELAHPGNGRELFRRGPLVAMQHRDCNDAQLYGHLRDRRVRVYGISFTISGTIGPVSSGTGTPGMTMQVTTPTTQAPAKNPDGTAATDSAGNPKPNCGTCTGTTCGTNVAVPVTTTPTTVTMTWAQLGVTTPNAITSITFAFTDPYSLNNGYATSPFTATPYPVNVTIDNIQFTM